MKQVIFDFGTLDLLGGFQLRIYGYGLMLVLGFLTGIALAKRRAVRAGEDPEQVTWLGMVALVGGIVGARLAYVIEQAAKGHWDEFVGASNPIVAVFNITSGGLIYYGGVVLAAVALLLYLRLRRLPTRRYLDIIAPSLLIGLAFGRAGCLLNGCCYGGMCSESFVLAQHFPMYSTPLVKIDGKGPFGGEGASPPYSDEFARGLVAPDRRLWIDLNTRGGHARILVSPHNMHGALHNDQLATMFSDPAAAQVKFRALAGYDGQVGRQQFEQGLKASDGFLRGSEQWLEAAAFDEDGNGLLDFDEAWAYLQARKASLVAQFDSNGDGVLDGPERQAANAWLSADLYDLAKSEHSHAVKPAQALSLINALLLAGLVMLHHPIRRREGQTFALAVILYPITRIMEEFIRADTMQSGLNLSHNQYTSVCILAVGVAMMLWLRRRTPSAGPSWAQRLRNQPSPARGRY